MAWGFNYSRGDRLHLQFAKFIQDPATPDEAALAKLEQLAVMAERAGLYLDVTGLGAYRMADTPEWYKLFQKLRAQPGH